MESRSRRGGRPSGWLPGVSALLAGIVLLLGAAPAAAHFDSGLYTHGSCAGSVSSRVDPINVVFWDVGTWDRAVNHTDAHTGWGNQVGGSQYFFDHGVCHQQTTQRASGTFSRYHLRYHPIHHDYFLGWTTVADAHHEDYVWGCNWPRGGHAVDGNGAGGSGFDQGRNALVSIMSAGGHPWYWGWWGNTQNFRQCDGDYAGSNGWVGFIKVGHAYH